MDRKNNELEEITSFISPSKNILVNKNEKMLTNENNIENDSLCTKFIRKKFLCIMTFLFTVIAVMHVLNTIVSKLSGDDISSLYGHILTSVEKLMMKSSFLKTNSSEIF